jgi:hypothetical protein
MAVLDSVEHGNQAPVSHPWLASLIFAVDARLRRRQAVVEYTTHPSCVFRLQIEGSPCTIVLRNGTRVRRGQRLVRLHFWNEQIPPIPPEGPTIAWARRIQEVLALSLRELVCYLDARPDLRDIAGIWADVPCGTRAQSAQIARIMGRYGFETIVGPPHLPIRERIHRFGENILVSMFVFAQNEAALRSDSLSRVRVPIFVSRRALGERFGSGNRPLL